MSQDGQQFDKTIRDLARLMGDCFAYSRAHDELRARLLPLLEAAEQTLSNDNRCDCGNANTDELRAEVAKWRAK